jgi:hypothetical protein
LMLKVGYVNETVSAAEVIQVLWDSQIIKWSPLRALNEEDLVCRSIACSIVPQPTTLPRAPDEIVCEMRITHENKWPKKDKILTECDRITGIMGSNPPLVGKERPRLYVLCYAGDWNIFFKEGCEVSKRNI